MKILGDEKLQAIWDRDEGWISWVQYGKAVAKDQDKDTLRQISVLLDGIEKSCNCDSPFCPADTWDGAIQAMKALLEE